jgi:NADH:ubiquinone oxidoreductase subunit 5 (subunit L)/multisubunit Na+/H+ antiporter MnhA subunit
MALLCFTKAFSIVFLGSPRSDYHEKPQEVSLVMKAAMIIQCIFIVIIGLSPSYIFSVMRKIAGDFVGMESTGNLNNTFSMFNQITSGLFLFIILSVLLYLIRQMLLKNRTVASYKTWDCGYQAGNTRMQYTASSYAAPFIKIIKPILNLHENLKLPSGPFPDDAHYHSHVEDKFETSVIDRMIDSIQKFLQLFSWIQSGNTQQYILYGIIFLIVISLYMIGV